MNLMPETKEEQSREKVSSYDILLAESDVSYPSRASEASEAWVSEMRKMSGEEMCM